MRVMQLVPRLDSGGAERSTLEMVEALKAHGHAAAVVCAGGNQVRRAQGLGCSVMRLDIASKSPMTLINAFRLRALVREWKPDIVHVRSRLPAWLWRMARIAWTQAPATVSTLHGMHSVNRYSEIMLSCDRAIAVSQTCLDYWKRSYPERSHAHVSVIERGVDLSWFRSTMAEPLFPGLPPFLLFPARGTRLKGHAEALHLLATAVTRGLDLGLVFAGIDEPGRTRYLHEMQALALQLGVSHRCRFLPAVSDLRPYFSQAVAMLQLSQREETFGRTVLEALACDCPVIGYAHGGVGVQLQRYYPAGAVAAGDRDALVATLERVTALARPNVRATLPSTEAMQSATLALYQHLLDEQHGSR